nr:unnamed protein product [Spirometra erinaceieuropaei]
MNNDNPSEIIVHGDEPLSTGSKPEESTFPQSPVCLGATMVAASPTDPNLADTKNDVTIAPTQLLLPKQSEEQRAGTEDDASRSRAGGLQDTAAAAANENASVENHWCQLQDTIQSTARAVLGRAGGQRKDWFGDNDAAINNLIAEKNRLHKSYVNCLTDYKKATFCSSRNF